MTLRNSEEHSTGLRQLSPAQINTSIIMHLDTVTFLENNNIANNLFIFQNQNEAIECLNSIKGLIENETPDVKKVTVLRKLKNQNEITYQFNLLDTHWKALRLAIRKKAISLRPKGDFFYKSLTANPYRCYYHRFIEELVLAKKFPKRIGEQKPVTVTGSGTYLRYPDLGSKYPFKKPQYSASEKKGFTNFQSASLGVEDLFSKVFSFIDKKSLSAGAIFEKQNVLLSERSFMYIGPTYTRSYDFLNIYDGGSYFYKHHGKNLFSKSEFEDFKKQVRENPDKISESLVRLKWPLDGTYKKFIGHDNLGSRLLAKQYADTLLTELKKANLCTTEYYIPICYYISDDPELSFKEYTQEEHQLDQFEAMKIAHDKKLKLSHYEDNQFEFLLALPSHKIQQFLTEEFKGLPLAIYLLKNGHEHIYRFLVEKTPFDLKSILDTLTDTEICREILTSAIRSGDLSLVTTLLQSDLKVPNKDSFSKFVLSALENNLPEIAYALISSKYFDAIGVKDKNNALVLASGLSSRALVKLLLDKNTNINSIGTNFNKDTSLMRAAYVGDTETVELLLANGADIEIKNDKGHTALAIAIYRGHTEVVKQLLSHQADVNTQDNNGNSPLLLALYCDYKDHKDIASLLLSYNADINLGNSKGKTPLHMAVVKGMIDMVSWLIDKGASINVKRTDGYTPLHDAIYQDQLDIAQLLIEKNADIHHKAPNGTPIFSAVYSGDLKALRLLLLHGAKLNDVDHLNNTILHIAVLKDEELFKFLLQQNIDIHAKNIYGNTALHLAASTDNMEIISSLLSKHANIEAKNIKGLTPLMIAITSGQEDAAQMLIVNGADLNATSDANETALQLAIKLERSKTVAFIKNYTAIQYLCQQAAIASNEKNQSIAYQLSCLFHCYAGSLFIFNPDRQIAEEICRTFRNHPDWTLADCKTYIEKEAKNWLIHENSRFAGLLNLIKTMEMKVSTQEVRSSSLLADNNQTIANANITCHGFLGKDWKSIYTQELYGLLNTLSRPYISINHQDLEKIKTLVKKGAALNQVINGKTILEWALHVHLNDWFSKDWICIKAIVEATGEADKNQSKPIKNFFLQKAVLHGQDKMIEYLIKNGAGPISTSIPASKSNNEKKYPRLFFFSSCMSASDTSPDKMEKTKPSLYVKKK